ncbi:MAG: dihydrofolate reductase [Clostridium sp.]|nr:dihydrofolate reductase [Clostridium sp.]
MLAAIAAVDEDFGLGYEGHLQFHIREDLKRFRELTKDHTVIYGRKTLETFPGAKPLGNRRNIILSRQPGYAVPGAEVVSSAEEALARITPEEEAFIIGGESVYREFMPHTDKLYLTHIFTRAPHDVTFPFRGNEFEPVKESEFLTDGESGLKYQFVDYKRR